MSGDTSAGQIFTARDTGSVLTGTAGADTFNASEASDTLTGGAGADVFHLGVKPWDPIHVADFQVGADRLDLTALLQQVGYTGSDPVADRYVAFADDGAGGTQVLFDRDGAGAGQAFGDRIVELDHLRYDPAAAGQMLATSGPALPAGGAFVLFAGQSNMGGAYTSAGNVDPAWKPDALTFIWQPVAHAWVQMDPGTNTGWSVPEQPDAWGPEVEFAIRFRAAHPDTPLYIVKDVHGGTDLASQWNPANAGHLFDEVTTMVTQAGGALGGRRPDALFWGQGEEDGMDQARAQAYQANLTNFFAAARSKWLSASDAKIAFFEVNTVSPYAAVVRDAQIHVDAADPNAASFDTAAYPVQPGEDHFTPAAINEAGAQFYNLYAGAAPNTAPNPTPNPGTSSGASSTGGPGDDVLHGSAGPDTLSGGAGNDSLDGGEGRGYLRGGDGNDTLTGGSDFDDTQGNAGDDLIHGQGGGDWVVGGKDNDTLFGDGGDDIVLGNLGADTCSGGDGADVVRGGKDDDVLDGGAGADWLSGDRGDDTIWGGGGADTFHSSADAGLDRIMDFNTAEGDRLILDAGSAYTLSQQGADTVVDMGGANRVVLVGVQLSILQAGWIVVG